MCEDSVYKRPRIENAESFVIKTHETGLKPDEHGFIAILPTIMAHFDVLRAADLCIRFGSKNLASYMRQQSFLPGSETWEYALDVQETLNPRPACGVLLYLTNFEVMCPHLKDIIQFCVDNNRITEILILLNPTNKFRNNVGEFLSIKRPPHIDVACEKGFVDMIQIITHIYPNDLPSLINRPNKTLQKVIAANRMEILKTIVPKFVVVRKHETLVAAAANTPIFLFLLNHIVSSVSILTEDVMVELASVGSLYLLRLCMERGGVMTQKAWDAAFTENKVDIVDSFPQFKVSDTLLAKVCRMGRAEPIESFTGVLPDRCLEASVKSGNAYLIHLVSTRVANPKINKALLLDAVSAVNTHIKPGDDTTNPIYLDPILAVFYCGKCTYLDEAVKRAMVIHNRQSTLQYFRQIDADSESSLDVFSDSAFLQAATCCNLQIMEMMLSDKLAVWKDVVLSNATRLVYMAQTDTPSKQKGFALIEAARKMLLK
jgi:hypothetical protein